MARKSLSYSLTFGFWWMLGLLSVVVFAAAAVGAMLALSERNAHTFNRWGAVISALGALFVFVQYSYDLTLEHIRVNAKTQTTETKSGLLGPVERRLGEEIARRDNEFWEATIEMRRRVFVAFIALTVLFGELVHGFGDQALLSMYPEILATHEATAHAGESASGPNHQRAAPAAASD